MKPPPTEIPTPRYACFYCKYPHGRIPAMKTAILLVALLAVAATNDLPPLPPEIPMPYPPRPSPSFYTAAMPLQNTNQALGPAGTPYHSRPHLVLNFGSGSNCLETLDANFVVTVRYTWDTNVYSNPIVVPDTNAPQTMFFRANKPIP